MKRLLPRLLVGGLASIAVLIVFAWFVLLRPVPQRHTNDPLQVFNHGSIGNEATQGLPYWIWRVLPTMFPEHLPNNRDGYGAIGVHWQLGEELPVGFSRKRLGVITRVAPNCAFCHQGSYRLHADDPSTFVAAGPGTRIDVQGFLRFLARSGTDPRFTADNVMAAIAAIYDMPAWERLLYRYVLIPAVRTALRQQAERFAWTATRPDWGPGRIDPFNPVKFFNLGLADDGTVGNSDIMPLWALNSVAADPTRRFFLHWDGLTSSLREAAVTGAIGDGMTYQSYAGARKSLDTIIDFIRLQPPPRSPFSSARKQNDPYYVDAADVEAGKSIYRTACAACHQPDGQRFRTVIPADELGTDRNRIDMWTPEARDRYAAYEDGYNWGFKAFNKTNGYIANELTGLWLRGPYLHNGSVPSLLDLLMPQGDRPRAFYRGYDLIDATNGGYVSAPGTSAERFGALYDTSKRGNSNAGHLYGTDLSETDKRRLLAYLKTL